MRLPLRDGFLEGNAHGGQFLTTRFSVAELIEELQEQLQPQLEQRGAELLLRRQELEVELQGNKDALLGALANLCMNALQACDGSPRIEIGIATTTAGLTLLVISFASR